MCGDSHRPVQRVSYKLFPHSSAVLITKSLVRVLEKVVKVLEESQTDCYDKLSVSNKPRELTKRDFADTYNVDVDHLQCMVTGISSSSLHASDPSRNSRVVVAHLLPRCADSSTKLSLGYTWDDMESIRNTVILCKGIKDAFDSKLISFVPSEKPFSNNAYKMHIWSEDVKTRPIYKGATETIGSYEGLPLHLSVGEQEHNLFTRAVSHQAFCAFKVWGKQCGLKELLQTRGFSIYKGSYKARREKYAKELAQAIEKDAEDGESDW